MKKTLKCSKTTKRASMGSVALQQIASTIKIQKSAADGVQELAERRSGGRRALVVDMQAQS